jgi:uncharacterized protein DUF2800
MSHHKRFAPSSFPKLAKCAKFQPDKNAGDETKREGGRVRHAAWSDLFKRAGSFDELPKVLDSHPTLTLQEREGLLWAAEYVNATATSNEALELEYRISILDDDFNELTFGTLDAAAGPDLFDLKWADADYDDQMICYALGRMQETGRHLINVHILFALTQHIRKFTVTLEQATERVNKIIADANDPNAVETPNEYCGYCAHRLTCKALNTRAQAVKEGREDWALENYHASQITDPSEMAKALILWRQLKDWGESVEYHAKQMARDGKSLPGFKLTEKQGKRECTDIGKAFSLLGLPQVAFLTCCTFGFGDAESAYAEFNGLKLAEAKRQVGEKLQTVTERKPTTYELRKERK